MISFTNNLKLVTVMVFKISDRHTHNAIIVHGDINHPAYVNRIKIIIMRILIWRIMFSQNEVFVPFDNRFLQVGQEDRAPVFDIRICAARANPFSRVSQNELACEFFRLGLFQPQKASEALACLSMMDFEGRDEMIRRISENAMGMPAPTQGKAQAKLPTHDIAMQARIMAAEGSNA